MARKLTPSYSDDASNVAEVTLKQDEEGKPEEAGASLAASQRVEIRLTQGEAVYIVDTSQANPLSAYLRRIGTKQAKRGRKAGS